MCSWIFQYVTQIHRKLVWKKRFVHFDDAIEGMEMWCTMKNRLRWHIRISGMCNSRTATFLEFPFQIVSVQDWLWWKFCRGKCKINLCGTLLVFYLNWFFENGKSSEQMDSHWKLMVKFWFIYGIRKKTQINTCIGTIQVQKIFRTVIVRMKRWVGFYCASKCNGNWFRLTFQITSKLKWH